MAKRRSYELYIKMDVDVGAEYDEADRSYLGPDVTPSLIKAFAEHPDMLGEGVIVNPESVRVHRPCLIRVVGQTNAYMYGRRLMPSVQSAARGHSFLDGVAEGNPDHIDVDRMLLPTIPWAGHIAALAHAVYHGTPVSCDLGDPFLEWLRSLTDSKGKIIFPEDDWMWEHTDPDLSRAKDSKEESDGQA
jgi:hypothetical protein